MASADKVRVGIAFCFPLGALLHLLWVWKHGDWMYHGPAPSWAVWFWYGLCVIDIIVCWLLLTRPKLGISLSSIVMFVSIYVNLTQFPTFEISFNWVLIGLILFAILVWATAVWLWKKSKWVL